MLYQSVNGLFGSTRTFKIITRWEDLKFITVHLIQVMSLRITTKRKSFQGYLKTSNVDSTSLVMMLQTLFITFCLFVPLKVWTRMKNHLLHCQHRLQEFRPRLKNVKRLLSQLKDSTYLRYCLSLECDTNRTCFKSLSDRGC